MVVSSVNIYTDPDTTHVGKSFVNIEKSVGPTTDPCGILYDTGSIPEGTPFTIVTCSLPFIQPLVLFNTKKKIVYISCHVQSLNVYFVLLNKGKQFDL